MAPAHECMPRRHRRRTRDADETTQTRPRARNARAASAGGGRARACESGRRGGVSLRRPSDWSIPRAHDAWQAREARVWQAGPRQPPSPRARQAAPRDARARTRTCALARSRACPLLARGYAPAPCAARRSRRRPCPSRWTFLGRPNPLAVAGERAARRCCSCAPPCANHASRTARDATTATGARAAKADERAVARARATGAHEHARSTQTDARGSDETPRATELASPYRRCSSGSICIVASLALLSSPPPPPVRVPQLLEGLHLHRVHAEVGRIVVLWDLKARAAERARERLARRPGVDHLALREEEALVEEREDLLRSSTPRDTTHTAERERKGARAGERACARAGESRRAAAGRPPPGAVPSQMTGGAHRRPWGYPAILSIPSIQARRLACARTDDGWWMVQRTSRPVAAMSLSICIVVSAPNESRPDVGSSRNKI